MKITIRAAQKGFTLIELMIVVAIIGVLATIALPQYQTHVAKSQMSRAVAESGALKAAVEACILEGKLTVGSMAADSKNCDPQAAPSTILAGAVQGTGEEASDNGYPQVDLQADGGGNGSITATFGHSAAAALQNKKVTWVRNANGVWTCVTDADQKYAQPGCKSTGGAT
jgi:type IV pilus assembly protein PilA